MIYGFGQLLAEESPTGPIYIQSDQVGSPNFLVDPTGAQVGVSKNLPFGERYGASGYRSSRRFTNHEETLDYAVYMQARMYLPAYGKFAQVDPAYDQLKDDPESWNLYSYVTNNPVTHTDPDGREIEKDGVTQAQAQEDRGSAAALEARASANGYAPAEATVEVTASLEFVPQTTQNGGTTTYTTFSVGAFVGVGFSLNVTRVQGGKWIVGFNPGFGLGGSGGCLVTGYATGMNQAQTVQLLTGAGTSGNFNVTAGLSGGMTFGGANQPTVFEAGGGLKAGVSVAWGFSTALN